MKRWGSCWRWGGVAAVLAVLLLASAGLSLADAFKRPDAAALRPTGHRSSVGSSSTAVVAGAIARIPPPEGPPSETTAIQVTAPGPPRYVFGSDGRTHVDYDLVITNAFTAEVTLKSLTITSAGRTLLRLSGTALADHTHQIIADKPSARIPVSSTVVTLVDVVLPSSAGRTVPWHLSNTIDYTIPSGVLFREVIGSTTVHGPVLHTTRRAPVVIASPVRGSGWIDSNGCCGDPTSRHRNAVLSANGIYVTPEMFDIDWVRISHGSLYDGDGKQLSDWPSFGAGIYAVANGVVVSTITDRPEVPPFESEGRNPTVRKPKDFGGNEIIEKIAPSLYAIYEHLQTGSIIVRPRQRLRTDQATPGSATPAAPPPHTFTSASTTAQIP